MGFLKKYIGRHGKLFLAALGFLTIEALCDLLQPAIMAKIIDSGVARGDMRYVIHSGLLMLGVAAAGAVAAVSRNIISNNVSQRFGAELRFDLFSKIQHFSFQNINTFETGSLVTRLTNDITQLQNFVNGLMRIFVKAPLVGIGSIIMAVLLDFHLSMILILVVPMVVFLIVLNIRFGYPRFRRVQKMMDGINTVMREYLSGVRVVKAFNRFDHEMRRFAKANQRLASASVKAQRIMAVFTPGMMLSVNLGIVAVLWIGGLRVEGGQIQVGKVIAFVNYMTQILFSLMMISMVFAMFVRARASAERIGEVMNDVETMIFTEHPSEPEERHGEVTFDHVSFSYSDSGDPVLRDLTFTGKTGETISIIGSTGSGKSSLVNLIPRFYDCTQGRILVDGIDIRKYDLMKLRDMIAIVPQKNLLFTGSILDNIRWGDDTASDDAVFASAEISQADQFIRELPEGYNTQLGQGGVNLSGGQKQRVAIARALLKKPSILILDDSTSAVDMITEEKIRAKIKSFAHMTCFIITQRIISARGADKIIVLDNGSVVGMGTHESLMSGCEVYQDIYRSQTGEEI